MQDVGCDYTEQGGILIDKIFLRRLACFGYHGAFQEEKQLGQIFYIDVELDLDLSKAAQSDKLEDSIDYSEVYILIKDEVGASPVNLIEHLAQRIIQSLFQNFFLIQAVKLQIDKKAPAGISGHHGEIGIQITRTRGDFF